MLADQPSRTFDKCIQIDRRPHVIRVMRKQRRRLACIVYRVHVRAFDGRESRGKFFSDRRNLANRNIFRQQAVCSDREAIKRKSRPCFPGDDLSGCVHAGIGAPCRRNFHLVAQQLRENALEFTGDCAQRRQILQAAKIRAVVFDDSTQGR